MIGPPGVSLALDAGPLDADLTWTRVDNLDGVMVESISITRGRPDERSKVAPAQVTIKGVDKNGVFDQTNVSSPIYTGLDPVKQCAVSLYRPDTAEWHWLVNGTEAEITCEFDVSEKWFTFEISFDDKLDIINDAEIIPDEAGMAVPQESTGDCYYTGQHVDDRILAALADSSTAFAGQTWPGSLIELASGNVFVQGRAYSSRTSLLQVIDEAVDAEYPFAANRFITKYGAFAFRGRFQRFYIDSYLAPNDASRGPGQRNCHWQVGDATAVSGDDTIANVNGMKWGNTKDELINAALVTPAGISNEKLAKPKASGCFSSDDLSIAQFGVRTSGMSFENLIIGDADDGNTFVEEAGTYADVIVQNYKDPVVYVKEFTLKNPSPGDSPTQQAAVWDVLTGIELSDLVTVSTYHPGGGGFNGTNTPDQDHFVEAINYEIAPLQGDEWMVTMKATLSSRHHFRYVSPFWSTAHQPTETLIASFTAIPSSGAAPLHVSVTDTSQFAVSWDWDWGDGSAHDSGFVGVSHTYSSPGTYVITLTVTDLASDTATATRTITVT